MRITYLIKFQMYKAPGLCGRDLYAGHVLTPGCVKYEGTHAKDWVVAGSQPECIQCLTSICSELHRKPRRIALE